MSTSFWIMATKHHTLKEEAYTTADQTPNEDGMIMDYYLEWEGGVLWSEGTPEFFGLPGDWEHA